MRASWFFQDTPCVRIYFLCKAAYLSHFVHLFIAPCGYCESHCSERECARIQVPSFGFRVTCPDMELLDHIVILYLEWPGCGLITEAVITPQVRLLHSCEDFCLFPYQSSKQFPEAGHDDFHPIHRQRSYRWGGSPSQMAVPSSEPALYTCFLLLHQAWRLLGASMVL